MGIRVNATEAAALVDRTERRVREWIHIGKLKAEPAGPRQRQQGKAGPSAWSIDVDELASVPGVTINRERLAELEAGRSRSPGGILARLEAVERELAAVRARLRVLELERGTHTPLANTPDGLANASPRPDVLGYPSSGYRPASERRTAPDDTAFPASIRGRSRWVEEHGGPRASWVREWPGVAEWAGPEDAIAAVRARARGYEQWQPDTSGY